LEDVISQLLSQQHAKCYTHRYIINSQVLISFLLNLEVY